jgi:hypothetical protein
MEFDGVEGQEEKDEKRRAVEDSVFETVLTADLSAEREDEKISDRHGQIEIQDLADGKTEGVEIDRLEDADGADREVPDRAGNEKLLHLLRGMESEVVLQVVMQVGTDHEGSFGQGAPGAFT